MPDNFTNDTTELLIQYMDNELSVSEQETIRQMLANDDKLNEQYQFLLAAKDAIKLQGLKQHVQLIQNEFLTGKNEIATPAKIIKANTFFKTFMRVAAVFIFVIAGFAIYEFSSTTNESVYNKNFVSYQLPVNRGNENADSIINLYNAGEYADVISTLNLKQRKNQQDYFLAAQSYLQLNQPPEAIKNFKTVEDLNNETTSKYFAEETDYYLMMAYIKAGNIELAKEQLNKILADKNHLFYNNAKKISSLQLKVLELKETK